MNARFGPRKPRILVVTTQPLGPLYEPDVPMPERLRDHFRPVMIADGRGELHEMVAPDLA